MDKLFTLITGASMGIGKAMAIECAGRKHNILIVALPGIEIEITAKEIRDKFHVEVQTLAIDLSGKEAPERVYCWCLENKYNVNFLINNAGIAGTASFQESEPDYSDVRILVNVRALVLLTRYFIPMLKQHEKAYILNIGSLSAYFPIPFKAVYSASKAFVLQFSKALRLELKNTGISVSVVCPNGVHTNEGTFERIKAHGLMGRLTQISSTDLAKIAIKGVYNRKAVIIPKFINRLLLVLKKFIPGSLEQKILSREFEKEMKVKNS